MIINQKIIQQILLTQQQVFNEMFKGSIKNQNLFEISWNIN